MRIRERSTSGMTLTSDNLPPPERPRLRLSATRRTPSAPLVGPVLGNTSVTLTRLAPGETDYLSAVIEGLPSPSWTSFALADAQDEISELLEGNNYGQFQVIP